MGAPRFSKKGARVTNDLLLPKQFARVLLRKLADDDTFRHHYEANPVHALRDIGVPASLLGQLPPGHQTPIKLAHKDVFQAALYQLIDDVAHVSLCLTPPQIGLAFGTAQSHPHGQSKVPFGES